MRREGQQVRAGAVQEMLLVHPDRGDGHPCWVAASRHGLVLRRLAPSPRSGPPTGPALRIPWRALVGLAADRTGTAPGGGLLQVVEVVTEAGTLTLMGPAPSVSALLGQVATWSPRWHRARRPWRTAVSRRAELAAGALGGRLAGVLGPLGRALDRAGAPTWTRSGWSGPGGGATGSRPPAHAQAGRALWPSLVGALAVLLLVSGVLSLSGTDPVASGDPDRGAAPTAQGGPDPSAVTRGLGAPGADARPPVDLPPASAPPAAAPPSLANAAPLQAHEIFGFAPYWTLDQSAGFDVAGMTTIAYFSVGVNPDGSLDESGSGWAGYQSQALADLVTRAHAADSRVVLTVNCFDQGALDRLTSSASAPATLTTALIAAVGAKNLDGVNLDFEGAGAADQAGLTHLVTAVSAGLKAVNPHYQVTMDTYASSAGDPNGFFDVRSLAPVVDAFFVMAYQLNLKAAASAQSPLTSPMFSDLSTVTQYAAAVPPSKVILGVPYYGYDWPTTDGTLGGQATGGATPIAYSQIVAGRHPAYWDPVTDTGWTSYQVGGQWHESFYEDPASLYMEAQLAQFFHIAGMGIWALGDDGNDPAMLGALLGFAPAAKGTLAGPTSTPPSVTPPPPSTTTSPTSAPVVPTTSPPPQADTPPTTSTVPSTTTTTSPTATTVTSGSSGVWQGQRLSLTPISSGQVPPGTPLYLGQLTAFETNDPALACLGSEPGLAVFQFPGNSPQDVVMAQQPADCTTADFSLPAPQAG